MDMFHNYFIRSAKNLMLEKYKSNKNATFNKKNKQYLLE